MLRVTGLQSICRFDAGLDMNVNTRLTRAASDKVLSLQNSGKNAVKNLLQGTQFSAGEFTG